MDSTDSNSETYLTAKPNDTEWIVGAAKSAGFDLCGVVRAEKFPELERFQEWIAKGYAGEMRYLEDPRRQDASLMAGDIHSVIVCGLNYNTGHPYSVEAANAPGSSATRGWISRYAWGRDYHEVLWERLNGVEAQLRQRFPEPFTARAYADTGPIAERVFAKYAGLGWLGKNTLLLNREMGSWFFLGVIVTSLQLAPSLEAGEPVAADLCGRCTRCIDACPTAALVEPNVMDARRCISYLTIELRGSIPEEFREAIGRHVYGCDICQDVCPFNRKAPVTMLEEFEPRRADSGKSLLEPDLEWLAGITEEEFRMVFRGSAMKRAKWKGLVRNACNALGNADLSGDAERRERIVTLMKRLVNSGEKSIAESAQWALGRIERE
jgi:epoxyqueuosine reductase